MFSKQKTTAIAIFLFLQHFIAITFCDQTSLRGLSAEVESEQPSDVAHIPLQKASSIMQDESSVDTFSMVFAIIGLVSCLAALSFLVEMWKKPIISIGNPVTTFIGTILILLGLNTANLIINLGIENSRTPAICALNSWFYYLSLTFLGAKFGVVAMKFRELSRKKEKLVKIILLGALPLINICILATWQFLQQNDSSSSFQALECLNGGIDQTAPNISLTIISAILFVILLLDLYASATVAALKTYEGIGVFIGSIIGCVAVGIRFSSLFIAGNQQFESKAAISVAFSIALLFLTLAVLFCFIFSRWHLRNLTHKQALDILKKKQPPTFNEIKMMKSATKGKAGKWAPKDSGKDFIAEVDRKFNGQGEPQDNVQVKKFPSGLGAIQESPMEQSNANIASSALKSPSKAKTGTQFAGGGIAQVVSAAKVSKTSDETNQFTEAEEKAAIKLQAIQRGHATRSRIIDYFAATKIQKSWRGKKARDGVVRGKQLSMWEPYKSTSSSTTTQSAEDKSNVASSGETFRKSKRVGLLHPINSVSLCIKSSFGCGFSREKRSADYT